MRLQHTYLKSSVFQLSRNALSLSKNSSIITTHPKLETSFGRKNNSPERHFLFNDSDAAGK